MPTEFYVAGPATGKLRGPQQTVFVAWTTDCFHVRGVKVGALQSAFLNRNSILSPKRQTAGTKNSPSCHITATSARRRQEQAAQAGGTLLRPRRRQSPRGVPRYIGKASIDAD